MDDYATTFVNEFCNQLAINERGLRSMHAFYNFEDKRPGTLLERWHADAEKFFEVHRMLYPPGGNNG
jgi:hypothetical protein